MRRSRIITICVLVVFVVASIAFAGGCMKAKSPAPKPLTPGGQNQAGDPPSRMVIGYYENPWPGTPEQTGSFPSMKTFGKSLSHVAPFWFKATKDGTLETKESQVVFDTARQMGLKIFPLIINKQDATDAILGDAKTRTKLVGEIIKVVKDRPYDGVNIDFELVPSKHKDNLTQFMTELYAAMKPLNKTVIISVFPKIDVASDVSGAYDYAALAKNADFIQVMLYDKHWATSDPGAIAPIDWYEKNLKYAIEQAGSPSKVIAGVGAYGYDWTTNSKEPAADVRYVDAIVAAEKNGVKIQYDDQNQAPHFKYKNHEIWFENDKSTAAKLDIVAKYNPAGIAIWRLGQEQPEIWPIIDKKFPKGQH